MDQVAQRHLESRFRDRIDQTRAARLARAKSFLAGRFEEVAPTEQVISQLETRGLGEKAARLRETDERMRAAPVGTGLARRLHEEANTLIQEALVGTDDMQSVQFLHRGSQVSMAVGRILSAPHRGINGTGFLISPRLLMTNHHVLPSVSEASRHVVEFLYGDSPDEPPVSFRLDPIAFFRTSGIDDLDCTVVAVEPTNEAQAELSRMGWCTLAGHGSAVAGTRANIVHHPRGAAKQVSIRDNFVAGEFPTPNPVYWLYASDTARGSSGSPVFNEDWQVVALHHIGMKIEDPEEVATYRRILRELGVGGIGAEDDSVALNEGVRMDLILDWLRAQERSAIPAEADLLGQVGTQVDPEQIRVPRISSEGAGTLGLEGIGMATSSGPVTFNFYLGAGGPQAQPSSGAPGEDLSALRRTLELYKNDIDDQKSIFTALNYLQTHREQAYLPDAAEIQSRKQQYYGSLIAEVGQGNLNGADLYDELHQRSTDRFSLAARFPESMREFESFVAPTRDSGRVVILESGVSYARARAHLYTWVDIQPHRMLQCPYTDALIAPEQLMLLDLVRDLGHFDLLPQRYRNNRYLNCEHIVPQSWFKDDHPDGVSDLHHLISADGGANNFRSDSPYRDVGGQGSTGPDNNPSYIPIAGRKTDSGFFEPARGKPIVARATLYFLLHYQGALGSARYDANAIETLKEWAASEAPSDYERHRNETIAEVQGNRNPLIDFPDWADLIDFTRGLA